MTDETPAPTGADFAYYERITGRSDYDEAEQDQIELLLEEALDAILAFTGGQFATPSGSETAAKNIQCRIVRRYFENPDGVVTESADGYSYSKAGVTGDIDLTDGEKNRLIALGIRKNAGGWKTIEISRGIRGNVW